MKPEAPAEIRAPSRKPNSTRRLVEIAVVALVYFAAARLGLLLALGYKNISPVWPPSGTGLAILLLFGVRLWPGIMLGAFLANYSTGIPISSSILICAGNALEAI